MERPLQVVLVCPRAAVVLLGQDISASVLAPHRKPEVPPGSTGRAVHDSGGPACLYTVSVGAFILSLKYINTFNVDLVYLRHRRVPTQNPQFVLLRTCKVYPRVLDKRYSLKVCHDTKKLLSTEFVVYISANHDLDFTNSLSMVETGVNRKLLALKVREHFSCLSSLGTLDTSPPSQQSTSPSAKGGAEEGTSAGRVSGGVWAD